MTFEELVRLADLYEHEKFGEIADVLAGADLGHLLQEVLPEELYASSCGSMDKKKPKAQAMAEETEEEDDDEEEEEEEEDDDDDDEEEYSTAAESTGTTTKTKSKAKKGSASSYGTFSEPVAEAFSDPKPPKSKDQLMIIELSDSFEASGNRLADDPDKRFLKVPIAVLGEWVHPSYGDVVFSQKDFDQMKENFSSKVTGYEPPLFLGHPVDRDSVESAPAVAFLSELDQEEDVLYGYYEVVDPAVYDDVRMGKYRYSSAELVREAVSKETGDKIGTCLIGCALTNRPFLTRMPRVAALAETLSECAETHTSFLFPLETKFSETNSNMSEATKEPQSSKAIEPASVEALTERYMVLAQQIENAEAKASRAEALLAERVLKEKLERIHKLNLSDAVKQEFSDLFQSKVLPEEAEEKLMASLHQLSEDNNRLMLQQVGTSTETQKTNEPQEFAENPFEDIIKANEQLAQKLAEKRAASIHLL